MTTENQKIAEIIEGKSGFLQKLRDEKRLQESSLRIYESEIDQLIEIMRRTTQKQLLVEIKAKLRPLSTATYRRKLLIWKSFLNSCPAPWPNFLDEIDQPKIRSKEPKFLSEKQVFQLESACYKSKHPTRNRLLVSFGTELGLRISETLQLRFSDAEGEWLKLMRKGGKQQRLPLNHSLRALIELWRRESQSQASDPIFAGRTSEFLSVRAAQKIIAELCEIAGLAKVSPHALRHSFATRLAAQGVSLASLKELLGHQSLTTTERYLHITPEHLRAAIESKVRAPKMESPQLDSSNRISEN